MLIDMGGTSSVKQGTYHMVCVYSTLCRKVQDLEALTYLERLVLPPSASSFQPYLR